MQRPDLIATALEALKQQGFGATLQGPPGRGERTRAAAPRLRIEKGKLRIDYVAAVQRTVTPGTIGPILHQLRHQTTTKGRGPLLVAAYVAPAVAQKLREHGQQFIDTAGNAYLDGAGLLVWITGRRPAKLDRAPRTDRTFTNAGLRLLFALICDPELVAKPYRTMAQAAGVALGVVPAILADLERQGRLAVAGRNRRFIATRALLDDWATAYARTLRPKTLTRRFAAPTIGDWERWDVAAEGGQWGGEPAANRLVGHLTPGVVTIYAAKAPVRLVVKHRLAAVGYNDPNANVELRQPFWGEPPQPAEPRADTVPAPLGYADLLATGDARCLETDRLVYEHHLARRFQM